MASIVKRKSKYSVVMITQMKTENADSVGNLQHKCRSKKTKKAN